MNANKRIKQTFKTQGTMSDIFKVRKLYGDHSTLGLVLGKKHVKPQCPSINSIKKAINSSSIDSEAKLSLSLLLEGIRKDVEDLRHQHSSLQLFIENTISLDDEYTVKVLDEIKQEFY